MHRLLRDDERFAVEVTDRLDLRFADEVAHVLSLPLSDLALESRRRGQQALAGELVGWAWALLRDERAEAATLGRNLMGESYVRGIQSLAQGVAYRTEPSVAARELG